MNQNIRLIVGVIGFIALGGIGYYGIYRFKGKGFSELASDAASSIDIVDAGNSDTVEDASESDSIVDDESTRSSLFDLRNSSESDSEGSIPQLKDNLDSFKRHDISSKQRYGDDESLYPKALYSNRKYKGGKRSKKNKRKCKGKRKSKRKRICERKNIFRFLFV